MTTFKNFNIVGKPTYELQHKGYSPGGPQDRFSCSFGNLMLNNSPYEKALEVFAFPFQYKLTHDATFVITGARSEVVLNEEKINRYQVYLAKKNDVIKISKPTLGVRCYVCLTYDINPNIMGRSRTSYSVWSEWAPKYKRLRVTKGPEYYDVTHWSDTYRIQKISDMGVSVHGQVEAPFYDIISSPVDDGTVQLTKSGLIVLMRSRQTIGGYPRVLNVINCDVDILAQMPEGLPIKLDVVSLDEAKHIENLQEKNLYELFL